MCTLLPFRDTGDRHLTYFPEIRFCICDEVIPPDAGSVCKDLRRDVSKQMHRWAFKVILMQYAPRTLMDREIERQRERELTKFSNLTLGPQEGSVYVPHAWDMVQKIAHMQWIWMSLRKRFRKIYEVQCICTELDMKLSVPKIAIAEYLLRFQSQCASRTRCCRVLQKNPRRIAEESQHLFRARNRNCNFS